MNIDDIFFIKTETDNQTKFATLIKEEFKNFIKFNENDFTESIYIISHPLGIDGLAEYDYSDRLILLIPGYPIFILNLNPKEDNDFNLFCDDLKNDIGGISNKYKYVTKIKRPGSWWNNYTIKYTVDINSLNTLIEQLKNDEFQEPNQIRFSKIIISLFTNSINDVKNITTDAPTNILETVKSKILLFDSTQNNFIFQNHDQKIIVIQGLAGTGKTELLLHKIKEIYTYKKNSVICLSCFNKVLGFELKNKLIDFFNFMKVDEQIKWNERLFVMSSWGSRWKENSGLFSYVSHFYNKNFESFSFDLTSEIFAKKLLNELNEIDDFKPCFDYLFIDEGQDFGKNFFDFCKKITKNTVYIAVDIFQDVFSLPTTEKSILDSPDLILKNCYRSNPNVLTFSHALNMGLMEKNKLVWLTDDQWNLCGYDLNRSNENNVNYLQIKRGPVNRFGEFKELENPIELIVEDPQSYEDKIIEIIKNLKLEYPNIAPDDIGIIFVETENDNYKLADRLFRRIIFELDWICTLGYEAKKKQENTLYISNINNVKGLEFPFVICISSFPIDNTKKTRNALYMSLTRSFLKSYLFLSNKNDNNFLEEYKQAITDLNKNNSLKFIEPSKAEKDIINSQLFKMRKTTMNVTNYIKTQMKNNNLPGDYFSYIQKVLKTQENIANEEELKEAINIIIKSQIDMINNLNS